VVAALIAGTANDLIFMALPLVDNFWQAQTTIMLTPRLPLYIPCVYVCFMYYATVSVWRLRPAAAGPRGADGAVREPVLRAVRHRRDQVPVVDLARQRPADRVAAARGAGGQLDVGGPVHGVVRVAARPRRRPRAGHHAGCIY
jgi:hypothetical protein